jgi:hypothetical protein
MDRTILDWFGDGNLPPTSRFTDIFLSLTSQLFFSPHLLAITFQFSVIPHGRQTLLCSLCRRCGTSLASFIRRR